MVGLALQARNQNNGLNSHLVLIPLQLYTRLLHTDSLQADSQWL